MGDRFNDRRGGARLTLWSHDGIWCIYKRGRGRGKSCNSAKFTRRLTLVALAGALLKQFPNLDLSDLGLLCQVREQLPSLLAKFIKRTGGGIHIQAFGIMR